VNAGSDNEDGDFEVVMSSKGLMDGPLDDKSGTEKSCRYGERCTRGMSYSREMGNKLTNVVDCKFTHPASRPTPKGKSGFGFGNKAGTFGSGMNKSKKFGSAVGGDSKKSLNPSAGSFVPGGGVAS
jgi:hypothetical protein